MRLPIRAVETIFLSIVVLVAAVIAAPAQPYSTDPLNRAERSRVILNGAPGELQALDRIQGRRDFQRQQQQYREQDRPRIEPQRLKVPRLQQGCQQRLTGNRLVTTCF
jgi:hypothetical protein